MKKLMLAAALVAAMAAAPARARTPSFEVLVDTTATDMIGVITPEVPFSALVQNFGPTADWCAVGVDGTGAVVNKATRVGPGDTVVFQSDGGTGFHLWCITSGAKQLTGAATTVLLGPPGSFAAAYGAASFSGSSQCGDVIASGAPAATITLSVGGSAAAINLTAGACYRLVCTYDVNFRTGSGTPTAVSSDAILAAKNKEKVHLDASSTAIAAYSAAAGTCSVNLLKSTP